MAGHQQDQIPVQLLQAPQGANTPTRLPSVCSLGDAVQLGAGIEGSCHGPPSAFDGQQMRKQGPAVGVTGCDGLREVPLDLQRQVRVLRESQRFGGRLLSRWCDIIPPVSTSVAA